MNRLDQKEIDQLVLVADKPENMHCQRNHVLSELDFKLPFVCCICSSFNS